MKKLRWHFETHDWRHMLATKSKHTSNGPGYGWRLVSLRKRDRILFYRQAHVCGYELSRRGFIKASGDSWLVLHELRLLVRTYIDTRPSASPSWKNVHFLGWRNAHMCSAVRVYDIGTPPRLTGSLQMMEEASEMAVSLELVVRANWSTVHHLPAVSRFVGCTVMTPPFCADMNLILSLGQEEACYPLSCRHPWWWRPRGRCQTLLGPRGSGRGT